MEKINSLHPCYCSLIKSLSRLIRIKLGFTRYPLKAFVQKPLECHECKIFGYVSSVCRREEYCMPGEVKCCNGGGEWGGMGKGLRDFTVQEILSVNVPPSQAPESVNGCILEWNVIEEVWYLFIFCLHVLFCIMFFSPFPEMCLFVSYSIPGPAGGCNSQLTFDANRR